MKDKIWQGSAKYITVAVIILIVTFIIGGFIITSLDNMVQEKGIDYVDVVVADKYINNDSDHYYVIVSDNGDLYDIINITDTEGLFDQIVVGNQYRFVTQAPYSVDDKYIHIVQVYNGTS